MQYSTKVTSSQQQTRTHLAVEAGAWQRLVLLQAVACLRCRKRRGVQALAAWQLWTACQRPGTFLDLQASHNVCLQGSLGRTVPWRASWQHNRINKCFSKCAGHRGHSN